MKIKIKKLHPEAKLPSFAHPNDAGMDLFAVEDFTVSPRELVKVRTGISMSLPAGTVALVWDKSGIATKRKIKTLAGVCDADYRGEYIVALINLGEETQTFSAGDKIAQILIQKVEHPDLVEVEELDETKRGEGGFGSTGN